MTYIALAVAALLVAIDQFTKWLAVTYIKPEGTIPLITINGKEWLNLNYQENAGAAFSILQNKQLFLIIITSIVLLAIIVLMLTKRVKKTSYLWAFAIIVAGGVGNLIDRIMNGFVVDFVDVRIVNFAVFNFADICAVSGAIALFIFVISDEIKASKSNKASKISNTDDEENETKENRNTNNE